MPIRRVFGLDLLKMDGLDVVYHSHAKPLSPQKACFAWLEDVEDLGVCIVTGFCHLTSRSRWPLRSRLWHRS